MVPREEGIYLIITSTESVVCHAGMPKGPATERVTKDFAKKPVSVAQSQDESIPSRE